MDKELRNGIIRPIVLFLIIFVLGITLIDFTFTKFVSGKSKNEVVELYKDNQNLFNKAKEELKEEYFNDDKDYYVNNLYTKK